MRRPRGAVYTTEVDDRNGACLNANLAEYLVPVHADIDEARATVVSEADRAVNAAGAKGVGEIGVVGVAAAIANAVFHATGRRLRPARQDRACPVAGLRRRRMHRHDS